MVGHQPRRRTDDTGRDRRTHAQAVGVTAGLGGSGCVSGTGGLGRPRGLGWSGGLGWPGGLERRRRRQRRFGRGQGQRRSGRRGRRGVLRGFALFRLLLFGELPVEMADFRGRGGGIPRTVCRRICFDDADAAAAAAAAALGGLWANEYKRIIILSTRDST